MRSTLTCAFAGPEPDQIESIPFDADWVHHLELFHENVDGRFGTGKVCDTTLTFPGSARSSYSPYKLEPTTPLLLSPTSSASSPPSTRKIEFTWDLPQIPQTPLQHLCQASLDMSTPLTPPESSKGALKDTTITTEPMYPTPPWTDTADKGRASRRQIQGTAKLGSKIRNFHTMLKSSSKYVAVDSSTSLLYESGLASINLEDDIFDDIDNKPNLTSDPAIPEVKSEDPKPASASSGKTSDLHDFRSSVSLSLPKILTDLPATKRETIFSAIERRAKSTTATSKETISKSVIRETEGSSSRQSAPQSHFDRQKGIKEEDLQKFTQVWSASVTRLSAACEVKSANAKHQDLELKTTSWQVKATYNCWSDVANVKPIPKRSFKNLEKVLEHILPFDLLVRMHDDPYRCVATKSRTDRCSKQAKGDPETALDNINAVSHCIKHFDYMNLPDRIEKLVRNTTCVLHKDVAICHQTIAGVRLKVLQDLVLSVPNVSEENTATFGAWLKAISSTDASSYACRVASQHHQLRPAIGLCRFLNCIIPFRMQVRLDRKPNQCVTLNCRELPRKDDEDDDEDDEERHSIVDHLLETIAQCAQDSTLIMLPKHVKKLVGVVTCSRHRDVAFSKLKMLIALVRNIASLPNAYSSAVRTWIKAFAKIDLPASSRSHARFPESSNAAVQTEPDTSKASAAITVSSFLSKFAPFQPNSRSNDEIAKALLSKISAPLTALDQKDGFIYMFWDQQHFGMIKIGRTNNLKKRLKEWDSQCKTTHRYHQSAKDGRPSSIPHVQRIEKLMHIELCNYRRKRTCDACGKTHIEWFDISAEKARQVYEKWRDWILQRPYAQDDAGNWVVRQNMLGSLAEVCRPVVFADESTTALRLKAPPKMRRGLRAKGGNSGV